MNDVRGRRLEVLIANLDDEDMNVANEAQYELIEDFGADALEPLLAAAPRFGDFGKLCATEVFTEIGDRRAAEVIVPWLRSDDWVVRDWTARTLASLGATDAISPLQDAWAAAKRAGPPDHEDATVLRAALYTLGARTVVLPADIAALRPDSGPQRVPGWPAAALPSVLEGLARARQVVVFQVLVSRGRQRLLDLHGSHRPRLEQNHGTRSWLTRSRRV